MKCHYVTDHYKGKTTRVLIPGCWNVTISQDIADCTCPDDPTLEQLQKQLRELQEKIKQYKQFRNQNSQP